MLNKLVFKFNFNGLSAIYNYIPVCFDKKYMKRKKKHTCKTKQCHHTHSLAYK